MLPSLIKQDRESLYVLARSNNILVVHGTASVHACMASSCTVVGYTASNVTLLALI
jgi:lipid A disaccharide synthetase